MKRRRRDSRDPSERALARRRPPDLFTLYSKDVRIDVLVGMPRVHFKERYVRQPFERVRSGSAFEDQPHYVHYFPARVRISWITTPERVLAMRDRDLLVESVHELSRIPRGAVWDAATAAIESYIHEHPSQRQRYVDYDPASKGVSVTWQEPAPRHMLASGGARLKGQITPRAVRLRIKMLLDQAESSAGFQAESAREKVESLIREYGVTEEEIRALQSEFPTRITSRSLLGSSEPYTTQRLPPKRDARYARYLRRASR